MTLLEHKFISDCDAANMVSSISLDSLLNQIALTLVGSAVISCNVVICQPDRHVYFGLFNGFELMRGFNFCLDDYEKGRSAYH